MEIFVLVFALIILAATALFLYGTRKPAPRVSPVVTYVCGGQGGGHRFWARFADGRVRHIRRRRYLDLGGAIIEQGNRRFRFDPLPQ